MYFGIDIIYIPRFNHWLDYTENQLLTIFSPREIAELNTKNPRESQFLASRFAIKEAFYKALSAACAPHQHIQPFGFRTIARFVEIIPDARWGCPIVLFNAHEFFATTGISLPSLSARATLSHDNDYTVAQVAITLL